jgi:positive regulator of sigma E activity
LSGERKKIIRSGLIYTISGILIMLVATWLVWYHGEESFWIALFTIILEPAGWFLFWEGLDLVIFESKRKNQDHDFYEKMSRSKIYFLKY